MNIDTTVFLRPAGANSNSEFIEPPIISLPTEKYEELPQMNFDTNLDENNELFDKVLDLVRKTIKDKKVLKQVLSDLKKYIDNLMYQARQIAKLSEEENPQVKQIGLLYKKTLEENFSKKNLTQKDNHKRRY